MPAPRPRRFLRFSLRTLLIVMTLICVGIVTWQQWDWQRKRQLIHSWIAPIVARAEAAAGDVLRYDDSPVTLVAPEGLTDKELIAILRFGTLHLDKPVERMAALKILVEMHGFDSLPIAPAALWRPTNRTKWRC